MLALINFVALPLTRELDVSSIVSRYELSSLSRLFVALSLLWEIRLLRDELEPLRCYGSRYVKHTFFSYVDYPF